MIRKTDSCTAFVSYFWIAPACALALLGILTGASTPASAGATKLKDASRTPFRISVLDAHGVVIADTGAGRRSARATPTVLAFDHEYQPGDRIVVSGPSRMAVRVDDWIPECLVYLASSSQPTFSFDIPYGQGEPATRSPFSQDSFAGQWHRVTARALTNQESFGYRNLAMNACDQELQPPANEGTVSQKQASVFPHAATNSVSKG
jgi:hypothetical protein